MHGVRTSSSQTILRLVPECSENASRPISKIARVAGPVADAAVRSRRRADGEADLASQGTAEPGASRGHPVPFCTIAAIETGSSFVKTTRFIPTVDCAARSTAASQPETIHRDGSRCDALICEAQLPLRPIGAPTNRQWIDRLRIFRSVGLLLPGRRINDVCTHVPLSRCT